MVTAILQPFHQENTNHIFPAVKKEGGPAVLRAIDSKEPQEFDQAMERLHNACVEFHPSRKRALFQKYGGTVER
jgi:hypothetical protein